MTRILPLLVASTLMVACGARNGELASPNPAGQHAPPAIDQVLDLVADGRLKEATRALQTMKGDIHASAVRDLIEERAGIARRLVAQAQAAIGDADLQAASRTLAFAIELDRNVDIADATAAHDTRAAQAEAAIARTAACAAQRQFDCVREGVEAAQKIDRHNPGAMFWSLYLGDWRPAR
jgi:hypothetical protein